MTAHAALDLTIPDSGMAAAFANAEKALAVNDPQSSTPAGTYFLSKFINLHGGKYTVRANASDPFSVWVGSGLSTSRRVIAQTPSAGSGFYEADFFVNQGVQRFDLTVSNLSVGPCFVVFSLWKDGRVIYSSEKTGWLWDTALLPDASLTATADPRLSLPVWTISPNWKSPVLERLWWLTDVLTSETSVEQRRSLLRNPKRSWEASFLRADTDRMKLNNFISGVGLGKFLCPFWPEQLKLVAEVSTGGQAIHFTQHALDDREFVADALVILTAWRDTSDYEIAQIESVTSTISGDVITLKSGVQKTWPVGTRITPLYVVRFDGTPSLSDETDRAATVSARFEAVETVKTIVPSWGNCSPLWGFKLDWRDKIQSQFERNVFIIDNPTGYDNITDYGGVTRVGVRAGMRLFGRKAVSEFKSFLAEARGRTHRFWFPSGTHDVEPSGAIGGLKLDVVGTGYFDWIDPPQDARRVIKIEYVGDVPPIYRRIENVEKLSAREDRLTLNRALPSMPRSVIKRISYIMPVRFDQDQFELSHTSDNCSAVRAAVVIQSADIDGMPEIECSVTSRPYPVVVNDAFTVSAAITGAWFGGIPKQYDSYTVSSVVTQLVLLNTLETIGPLIDSLNTSAEVVSAQLSNQLETVDNYLDKIDVTAAVTAALFQTVLIEKTIDTDSLDMSATVTAGTLS